MSLDLIFSEDDRIFISNINKQGTCDEFVGSIIEVATELTKKSRTFYCINPIQNNRRIKAEVGKYQNFLLESDTIPLEKQIEMLPILENLGIIRTATFSGNKSIHFIVSCSDDLYLGIPGSSAAESKYKEIWKGLASILENVGFPIDSSNNQPVVLSRLPGTYRGAVKQSLWYTGNLVSSEFLKSISVHKVRSEKITSSVDISSLAQLEAQLAQPQHSNLRMYLRHPTWVNQHAGNYQTIFRIACWAIDELGISMDIFIAYFEKYTLTFLLKANYYKDWKKPIYDAYYHKGKL